MLLDIQDAFSQNSGLISNFTVGAKEFRDCFSGTSFMRWLRDDGGRHLSEHAVDFSHEGERKRRVQQRVAHSPVTMVAGVLCQLAQEMLDEHIMRSLSDNPQFYVPHVRLSVVRSRPAAAAAPPLTSAVIAVFFLLHFVAARLTNPTQAACLSTDLQSTKPKNT